ncbi:NAD(P)H-dependent oxidoreductase [Myxococcota bacterium]|nr:NAD(P)H-dependent oxidoreductase [Myxococcota bacterium]
MTSTPLRLLGISGSLRKHSLNTALLQAAQELLPPDVSLTLHPLNDIPLYNGDLESSLPEAVSAFKHAIAQSDGLLISTPEYNYSIPGVLKNAIDWASRPAYKSPLAHKPVGILGASPSPYGTVRAQDHLRHVLAAVHAYALPHHGLLLGGANQKFDEHRHINDPSTRERLQVFLADLASWTRRFRTPHHP